MLIDKSMCRRKSSTIKSRAVLFVTVIIFMLSLSGLHHLCNRRYLFSITSFIPDTFLNSFTCQRENPCNWQRRMGQIEASRLEIESQDLQLEKLTTLQWGPSLFELAFFCDCKQMLQTIYYLLHMGESSLKQAWRHWFTGTCALLIMMYSLSAGLVALWPQKDDMLISADKQYVVVLENLMNVHPVEVLLASLLSLSANADQVLEISS